MWATAALIQALGGGGVPLSLVWEIWVQVETPAELWVDGVRVALIAQPMALMLPLSDGDHHLSVWVLGREHTLTAAPPPAQSSGPTPGLRVAADGVGWVALPPNLSSAATEPVTLMVEGGSAGARLSVAGQTHTVLAGASLPLSLPPGSHPVEVRSPDGLMIWSRGVLYLPPASAPALVLRPGRAPAAVQASWTSTP